MASMVTMVTDRMQLQYQAIREDMQTFQHAMQTLREEMQTVRQEMQTLSDEVDRNSARVEKLEGANVRSKRPTPYSRDLLAESKDSAAHQDDSTK